MMLQTCILAGAVLLPAVFAQMGIPFFIDWQAKHSLPVKNFEGKKIATAGGAVLFLALLLDYPLLLALSRQEDIPLAILFFYLFGIALLGAIDDIWGEKECKGIRGHFLKLWRREGISTGAYKAVGGLLLGTIITAVTIQGNWVDWVTGGLFLALLSNFFNLLDTRPARSVKMFFILSVLLMVLSQQAFWILIPVWGLLAVYINWEINKQIMLGDTGAYLLGGVVGFSGLLTFSTGTLIVFTIALLLLHLFCEKYSLNRFIEEKLSLYAPLRPGRKN